VQENRGAGDCSDPNSLQSEGALTLSRPEDMAESTPRVCAAAVRRSGVRKENRNGGTCAGEEESGSIVSQHRLNESVFDGNGNVAAGVTYIRGGGGGGACRRLCEPLAGGCVSLVCVCGCGCGCSCGVADVFVPTCLCEGRRV